MRHADPLLLVWRLAELEAINVKSERTEPLHFVLGLLKIADIDVRSLEAKGGLSEQGTIDEIERDIRLVRECFDEFRVDVTKVRRSLRRRMAKATRENNPQKGRLRRSSGSREAFSRAEHAAETSGSDVRALHLLFALVQTPDGNIEAILEESGCPAAGFRTYVEKQLL